MMAAFPPDPASSPAPASLKTNGASWTAAKDNLLRVSTGTNRLRSARRFQAHQRPGDDEGELSFKKQGGWKAQSELIFHLRLSRKKRLEAVAVSFLKRPKFAIEKSK